MTRLSDEELAKIKKDVGKRIPTTYDAVLTAEQFEKLLSTIDSLKDEVKDLESITVEEARKAGKKLADEAYKPQRDSLIESNIRLQAENEVLKQHCPGCEGLNHVKALLKKKDEEIERLEKYLRDWKCLAGEYLNERDALKQKVEDANKYIDDLKQVSVISTKLLADKQARLSKYEELKKAGEKIKLAQESEGHWGHAGVCSFVSPELSKKCNCGIADLMTALRRLAEVKEGR